MRKLVYRVVSAVLPVLRPLERGWYRLGAAGGAP